ncbi:MAG TPA: phosphoenolpyruvate--protein phosphotransferase [Pseudogracilibacillus sp.]|nr:phosphoenolpyruvate--protein phosphotransferase [Pseudogracilibacillus sp.]
MSEKITGIAAANGYGFGKAYELVEPDLSFEAVTVEESEDEIHRLQHALELAMNELSQIKEKVYQEQGEENAKIFDAHMLVLQDPELIKAIEACIESEKVNAEHALNLETDKFITMFEQLDNEYMRERASDIKDVRKRVLAHLLERPLPNLSLVDEPTIIVAEDLTPSDTAQVNKEFIKGFVTDIGGRTSHSAIMARTLEIPAVVGSKTATSAIKHGEEIILDGMKGEVSINPDEAEKAHYKNLQKDFEKQLQEWAVLKDKASISKDGHQVELGANIGSFNDMETVKKNGAEAVGLYRTEFLYMENSDFPSEDEQFEAYKKVLEAMDNHPVVIRTIDIGGDKTLGYWELPEEMNPFLGERAIRLALNNESVFRTQLRALLRASHYGDLRIMFPMVATLEEFRKAKQLLLDEKEALVKENIPVSDEIQVGIMVEIPSTAVLADQFAKEVDFFSIGTNDLIQYTFAADRMNEAVSYLYQPYHPAILQLVSRVIKAAHAENKWVGMCGEMAGDQTAIPLLLGLGLDEFSMSPSSILPARSQISQLNKAEMEQLAEKACSLSTSEEVEKLVASIHS